MSADVAFTVTTATGRGSTVTTGTVRSSGRVITVELSRTPSLLSSPARSRSSAVADQLDAVGLEVRLVSEGRLLLALGSGVRAPWWQYPLPGSRRIRVAAPLRVVRHLNGPRLFAAALPARLRVP